MEVGRWQKTFHYFTDLGVFFAAETSLIICEGMCRVRISVCVCVWERGIRVFGNNKASENEEELNCVSHFSFPCFSACQKKAPRFWMMEQTTKVNNKPCGCEDKNGVKARRKESAKRTWRGKNCSRYFKEMTKPTSQYQYVDNTTEHALKMKHNRGGKITCTVGTRTVLEGPFKGLI